ncbi:TatD family hydrolase, partial [Proteus myxofaciens]|uniref:TatD family hydrolase n=1 Tax=Proteus myxofaciens TaxID=184072 RepID=UPI000B2A7803
HTEQHLVQLHEWLQLLSSRCVAIGEIGLDGYMENPQPEKQEHFLIEQFKLAIEFNLPVILHSRKTHDKLSALLRRY